MTRILLGILFVLAAINRIRAALEKGIDRTYWGEVRYFPLMGAAGIAVTCALLYSIRPEWFSFGQLSLGGIASWVGNLLTVLALGLWSWSKVTLGNNWSTRIAIRKEHTLTRSGPYAYVRHPVYSSYILLTLGIGLATGNWIITLPFAIATTLTLVRTRQEEAVLKRSLGHKYSEYMKTTGKFFPRLKV